MTIETPQRDADGLTPLHRAAIDVFDTKIIQSITYYYRKENDHATT